MDYPKYRQLIIDEWGAGQRIDAFLSRRFSKLSRSSIARFILSREVLCIGRVLKPSSILSCGDVLQIFIPGLAPSCPPPPLPPILFENSELFVVSKPSGMLVHPSGDDFVWSVITLFKINYPEQRLDLVHRLDRETSGTLIITKNKNTNSYLKKQLEKRNINKVYHAIVKGDPDWDSYDLHAPIDAHPTAELRLRRAVQQDGAPSHTTFYILKRMGEYSLVKCQLHSGRTHQIRVHLEYLGYPILGDKIYGQTDQVFLSYLEKGITQHLKDKLLFSRQCLHAAEISFKTANGDTLTVTSPTPSDMQSIIDGQSPFWK